MLESHFEVAVSLGVCLAVALAELARRQPWIQRSFDPGGLRVRNLLTGTRFYVPFSSIAGVDVERGKVLVLRDRRRAVIARVFHSSPEACGKTLAELPRFAGRPLGACAALARRGFDLESWLGRVRALAAAQGPYRGADVDPERALALARCDQAPLSERAAAVYFLSCVGERPTELLAGLSQASPPLLVVVAALAPGGEALLALAEDLVRYLPPEDQTAFRRTRQRARARTPETTTARNPRTA